MSFNTEMQAVALQLLEEFGSPITLTRTTEGVYNPTSASTADGSDVAYTGFGIADNYRTFEISGTTIQTSDIRLYINKLTVVPIMNDKITYTGVDYRVVNVNRIRGGGDDIIYELQLRI